MTNMSAIADAVRELACEKPALPTREQILVLQAAMFPIQCEMPEAVHHYAAGMYAREFSMPAGMTVVGKKHLHQHFMMVLKGRARVVTEFDDTEVVAPFIHVSQPGAKRVVYAIEDTTFVTVHLNPSDTHDLDVIEAEHIEPEGDAMRSLAAQYRKELK